MIISPEFSMLVKKIPSIACYSDKVKSNIILDLKYPTQQKFGYFSKSSASKGLWFLGSTSI